MNKAPLQPRLGKRVRVATLSADRTANRGVRAVSGSGVVIRLLDILHDVSLRVAERIGALRDARLITQTTPADLARRTPRWTALGDYHVYPATPPDAPDTDA